MAADDRKDEKEEKQTQKKRPRGWKCMPYIIGNETFERLAGTGLMANFTVYLVNEFHMKQVNAANVLNIFLGTTNFAPLLGAFLSDAYIGRFYTLAFASVIEFFGMVMLTLSAFLPQLRPPKCPHDSAPCPGPNTLHLAALYVSMFLLVVGAGGIRPCSLPFGVDQFDSTTAKGRRGLNSFFNWYYFTTAVSLFISITVMSYIQDTISWSIGFGIPTALMLLAIILFFVGTPLYIRIVPEGSVFSDIAQVIVAAVRKRRLPLNDSLLHNPPLGSDHVALLPLTTQFRCLNKAAIELEGEVNPKDGSRARPWRLCTVQQIEEVKCLIRIIPIWASGILCFTAVTQQWTFSVLQSLKMNRHVGANFKIPPGSVGAISLLGLSLFIPLYDRLLVPLARRFTKLEQGITLLQRQGAGMVVMVMSMVVAGIVERKRRDMSVSGTVMSVMWLMPQLLMMGVSEALNAVGQIEFYNRQFPEHMQTLAGSLYYLSSAGGSYLSSILLSMVRKATGGEGRKGWLENDMDEGRLDYFYYMIAVLGTLNLVYFVVCALFYRYKGMTADEKRDVEHERRLTHKFSSLEISKDIFLDINSGRDNSRCNINAAYQQEK